MTENQPKMEITPAMRTLMGLIGSRKKKITPEDRIRRQKQMKLAQAARMAKRAARLAAEEEKV